VIKQYEDWIGLKIQIAESYAKNESIDELEREANEIEKKLVMGSREFSDIKKVHELTWKDVQSGLNEGDCAIEFLRIKHHKDYHDDDSLKVQLYTALIIDKDCEHPTMVSLFQEKELEKILGTFPGNNLSYIEQVYGTKENTKSQLYDLIWKPMEKELENAKRVYISPVGLLHKISFAALAKEQDIYLCDIYDIEMKSSTGKIVLSDHASSGGNVLGDNSSIALFGGIDYNTDSTSFEIWPYLEGSLGETQQIEKILKKEKLSYSYYSQRSATEANFKEIASKASILHVATHGFFYQDPEAVTDRMIDEQESNIDMVFRGGMSGMGMNTFVNSTNPMMRSGLAFAGANDVWNRLSIEGEDGVLTAAEVATLDLRKAELVVLSACETGLGDIKEFEGVYGLQRSFKMAGVKYLIMSLWQVPDKETSQFMTTFYKQLAKTNDIKLSFDETQREMRKKYDPYYWAAFVLLD
ncbi:CHAT domain-containing protein, partial [bacterium AH-315-B15]|nr:CHAT domain-containing protein [bacterium AH-315-B15]